MTRAPRSLTTSLLIAALAVPGLVAAESASLGQQPSETELAERLRDAERQLADMRRKLAEKESETARWDSVRSLYERALAEAPAVADRPRLGVTIDTDSENGARLLDVLRSGPAYEAGLRADDLVTHIDGTSLLGGGESPGQRLIRMVREAGEEEMELRYERDGESFVAQVTPRKLDRPFFSRAPIAPRPVIAPRVVTSFGLWNRWSDMQLVPMNDGLESYFGVGEGLLVISPPEDNELLGLAAGDVVLSVGDREPRNATHFLRILRSYEPGETVRVNVMRQKRRETLSFELPERVGTLFDGDPSLLSPDQLRTVPPLDPIPFAPAVPKSDH